MSLLMIALRIFALAASCRCLGLISFTLREYTDCLAFVKLLVNSSFVGRFACLVPLEAVVLFPD